MARKYDIVIVGGGAAGIAASATARAAYPDKSALLIRATERSIVPCAIPYIFKTLDGVEKNFIPDEAITGPGTELMVDKVVELDVENKRLKTEKGEEIEYDKLVLATGSLPAMPPIPGSDLDGVHPVYKDPAYLAKLREEVLAARNIVIVGGGFIGVEMAEEFSKLGGKSIHVVEILPHLLEAAFDEEFCVEVEEELKGRGIEIHTGRKALRFEGDGKVEKVVLDDGTELVADLVIVATGAKPNISLAEQAGIRVGRSGAIEVDEYMRTSVPDVFAVGDCAEKRDFFTRKPAQVMLASVACAEARTAVQNLFKLRLPRQVRGTIAAFSTKVGRLSLGVAGLTEEAARREGFEVVVGEFETVDRHPAAMPETCPIRVKLLFSKGMGILLGGQVMGGPCPRGESSLCAGEIVNILGMATLMQLNAAQLETLQVATHPWLTPAPTVYPIVMATQAALPKIGI